MSHRVIPGTSSGLHSKPTDEYEFREVKVARSRFGSGCAFCRGCGGSAAGGKYLTCAAVGPCRRTRPDSRAADAATGSPLILDRQVRPPECCRRDHGYTGAVHEVEIRRRWFPPGADRLPDSETERGRRLRIRSGAGQQMLGAVEHVRRPLPSRSLRRMPTGSPSSTWQGRLRSNAVWSGRDHRRSRDPRPASRSCRMPAGCRFGFQRHGACGCRW